LRCKRLKNFKLYDGTTKQLCEGFKTSTGPGSWMERLPCHPCTNSDPQICPGFKEKKLRIILKNMQKNVTKIKKED